MLLDNDSEVSHVRGSVIFYISLIKKNKAMLLESDSRFGTYQVIAQRGHQVYREPTTACRSLPRPGSGSPRRLLLSHREVGCEGARWLAKQIGHRLGFLRAGGRYRVGTCLQCHIEWCTQCQEVKCEVCPIRSTANPGEDEEEHYAPITNGKKNIEHALYKALTQILPVDASDRLHAILFLSIFPDADSPVLQVLQGGARS